MQLPLFMFCNCSGLLAIAISVQEN